MSNFQKSILFFFCLGLSTFSYAQIDTLDLPSDLEYEIESYIENIGEEVDFDFNTVYEQLNNYLHRPMNLNKVDREELEQFNLLNTNQINSLINYKVKNGDLIAIYELQAVPNFDLATIQRILPFVTLNKSLDDLNESFSSLWKNSQKNLYTRWSRGLETQKGYLPNEDGNIPFAGDANKLYLRYIQDYENRLSFGFTMEKDPGEKLLNKKGNSLDFMSAHFLYKKVNKTIDRIVIGDFRARFGQGLIVNTGYAPGKSAFVTNIKRSGSVVNRFTSVNEQLFFRGFGTTLNLGNQLQLSGFASFRKRDGNAINPSEEDLDLGIQSLNSLQLSGLHRTESEIEGRNTLNNFGTGLSLKYKHKRGNIALNGFYNRFDRTIGSTSRLYSKFYFKGNSLLNASLDYSYSLRNLHFFGETGWSDNNSFSSVNGLIANIHPKVAFALHSRFMPKDFHTLFGQTFSETNGNRNENGLYMGVEVKATREWRFAAYVDAWRHPWLRFRADAPSRGLEYFARATFYKRRDLEAYIHWKYERKQESYKLDYTNVDELLYKQKTNLRFQLNKKVTKRLELRSRIEVSVFDIEESVQSTGNIFYNGAFRPQSEVKSTGFVAFQDIIFKPVNIPLSLTTRFAIFDVDTYDARIYAFENDVTYQFSIPAYYNKGTRFYANFKYRARKHLTLEARYAQTYWANQTEIGSGNSRIEGQTRSEVKVQMRWKF